MPETPAYLGLRKNVSPELRRYFPTPRMHDYWLSIRSKRKGLSPSQREFALRMGCFSLVALFASFDMVEPMGAEIPMYDFDALYRAARRSEAVH
jgi:hypothetical protein